MMKRSLLSVLALSALLWSCNKDASNEIAVPERMSLAEFSNVTVDGQVKVKFTVNNTGGANMRSMGDDNGTSQDPGTVIIKATADQRNQLVITSSNGELYVSAGEGIQLGDSVVIEVFPETLEIIKLQSEQKAIFEGVIDQESLEIVTEAKSELEIYGLRVNQLTSVQQGESKLTLSTLLRQDVDSVSFDEASVMLMEDSTLLVDQNKIVFADSVKRVTLEDESREWRAYGDDIRTYYRMNYTEYKTEGNVRHDASDAVSQRVSINLEGSSQAKIWATDELTGKGEGSSVLYFKGAALQNFSLQGEAQLLPIED